MLCVMRRLNINAKQPRPAPSRLGLPPPRRVLRVIGTGSRRYGCYLPRCVSLIVNSSRPRYLM
ncbi:hypothetical protein CGRA01v4_00119 [Colletotrichum graminicola]|nr:hypothetical protein CGRA01v4_00119 [Colletotrichum graminicola]